jgi:hypothetical protein
MVQRGEVFVDCLNHECFLPLPKSIHALQCAILVFDKLPDTCIASEREKALAKICSLKDIR